jgi:cysteine synthase B
MATAIIPRIYDPTLADRDIGIETEDAYKMVRRMARDEGLLVGISAGGNVQAALQLAKELHDAGKRGVIVTVLCDGADKYLSEHFWDETD